MINDPLSSHSPVLLPNCLSCISEPSLLGFENLASPLEYLPRKAGFPSLHPISLKSNLCCNMIFCLSVATI
jgi:hypothetical protein